MGGHIILITGDRGAGKTTVCRKVIQHARAAGYDCAGLLTFPVKEKDQRVVMDVRSGNVRPLTTSNDGVQQGRFHFDPAALQWGTAVLASAIPCDLLVIDELGPLEIERQEGWRVGLDLLHSTQFRMALVVVRPELICAVQFRLPASAPAVVPITQHNRDGIPSDLVKLLMPRKNSHAP